MATFDTVGKLEPGDRGAGGEAKGVASTGKSEAWRRRSVHAGLRARGKRGLGAALTREESQGWPYYTERGAWLWPRTRRSRRSGEAKVCGLYQT